MDRYQLEFRLKEQFKIEQSINFIDQKIENILIKQQQFRPTDITWQELNETRYRLIDERFDLVQKYNRMFY